MIKRPLAWLLTAYLFGILLAWQKIPILLFVLSVILVCIILYLMMYQYRNPVINQKDTYLWSVPILLILGFAAMGDRMKQPPIYNVFDRESACTLSGQIERIVERTQGQALYVKNNTISFYDDKAYQCERVIVYSNIRNDLNVGNQISVSGTLLKFLPAANPGQFDERQYYQIEQVDFKLQADTILVTDADYSFYHAVLQRFKNRLIGVYASILEEKEAGTLIAMLLGEKYLLDDEIKQLYQTGGISHILAISGLHVSLIGMTVFWLLKKCRLCQPAAAIITILFIISYGVLTNFSVSTNRAVVMMIVMLLSPIFSKTYDTLSAMALSALIILLQNPLQLFSAGFLLSFGAVLGLGLVLPCLKLLITIKHAVVDSILLSLSATVVTTPLILYFFYQFPAYSVLVNLLALPFVTVLTLSSMIAGIAGIIYQPLGIFLIGGSNYILKLYEGICRMNDQLPGSLITVGRPDGLMLALSAILLITFIILSRRYQKNWLLLVLLLSMAVLFLPRNNEGLRITMLDIGQGDAIFLKSDQGTTYLIDGGSTNVKQVGKYRILPYLRYNGVDQIDYAIVTHSDQDHVNGLSEIIESGAIQIKLLLLPEIKEKDENYLALLALAREKKIAVGYLTAGSTIADGELIISCLHPGKDFVVSSPNSYSTVLSLTYGEFDMLFTGDLELEGEEQLIRKMKENYYKKQWGIAPATDYDILKVAHHGSKYSTSEELLQYLQPETAWISCGWNNWYGHPHPELLQRLTEAECKTYITYESGAITAVTDGERLRVWGYLGER